LGALFFVTIYKSDLL